MDQKFLQALTAANNGAGAAPVASPISEISNYFSGIGKAQEVGSNFKGLDAGVNIQAKTDKDAEEAARQAQIDALQQQAQDVKDKLDPSKYRQVRKQDGGFDYYDPTGKRVDLRTYAEITGQSPSSILKDSDNSLDQQYVTDYKNLQVLADAFASNDKDTIDEIKANDPGMAKYLQGKTMADVMRDFKAAYPNIYKQNVSGEAGAGRLRGGPGTDGNFASQDYLSSVLGGGSVSDFINNQKNTRLGGLR